MTADEFEREERELACQGADESISFVRYTVRMLTLISKVMIQLLREREEEECAKKKP